MWLYPQQMPAYTRVRAASDADASLHVAPRGMPHTWYAYLCSVKLFFNEFEFALIHEDAEAWLRRQDRECELEGGDQYEAYTPLGYLWVHDQEFSGSGGLRLLPQ